MQHNELLPSCDGPKMHPFGDPNPKIEFEERLDDENGGHVFKVKINSQPFALKVFKFFDTKGEHELFDPDLIAEITNDIFEQHIDPFYAECRAYGRINEFYNNNIPKDYRFPYEEPQGAEKKIAAAQCYGYLHLSAKEEEYLRKNHPMLEWNRPEKDKGKPIRALVKQLIERKDPIHEKNQSNTSQMRDNLRTLHSIGIIPNNVAARDFQGGLYMSFSKSYTVPHFTIQNLPEWRGVAELEMQSFDQKIDAQRVNPSMTAGC